MSQIVGSREKRVAVISGGLEYELDDIGKTEHDVVGALKNLCWITEAVSLRDSAFLEVLQESNTQACFIVDPFYLVASEDGTRKVSDVRDLLERLGLPYTGSGPRAAALCRDKIRSKDCFRALGIDTPRELLVSDPSSLQWAFADLGLPLIVKPRFEGSGVGVVLCASCDALEHAVTSLSAKFPDLMIEEYIAGTEVTVGVVGTGDSVRALPVVELELLASPIYDYATKREADLVNRYVPARLPSDVITLLEAHAKRIHVALGCSGVSRIDFRVSNQRVVAIEINASPSLSRDEHIPRSVRALGWQYEDLIALILADALRGS